MFELFLRHHYRLCMSKIPAGGAPSTLKSQRCDGDVGCTPFRWAVRARAHVGFGLSSSLCSSRLRAYQYSMFLSHNELQRMPLNEQDEPEYPSNVFRTSRADRTHYLQTTPAPTTPDLRKSLMRLPWLLSVRGCVFTRQGQRREWVYGTASRHS